MFHTRFRRDVRIRYAFQVLLVQCLLFNAVASAQTWTPAWSDEFDGEARSAIDPKKWQFERGDLKVNNELEFYCAPTDPAPCDSANPNAFLDGKGHLVIQALRVSDAIAPSSNAWTSARLNTANKLASFQYGRIESRMQLPVGPGIWPAFWSLGTDIGTVDWPSCGEMDFMENVPASGGLGPGIVKSTIHGPGYSGGEGLGKDFKLPDGADVTTPHTYGAIWSPFMVQFYVDDPKNVFFVLTARDIPAGKQWVYNHPFFLVLNLAVGGTDSWPGPPNSTTASPARMVVDYVRAYKSSIVAPPIAVTPAPLNAVAGSVASTTLSLKASPGSGRVYLSCSTNAPKSSCQVSTGDTLNDAVADFSTKPTVTTTVRVTTTANTASAAQATDGTTRGSYAVTVNSYTLSSDPSDSPTYGTITIPMTVK